MLWGMGLDLLSTRGTQPLPSFSSLATLLAQLSSAGTQDCFHHKEQSGPKINPEA